MALNALFTGSAALTANSNALDVVGNNLANSNTTAFKSQRVQFKDFVYQTLSAGSGPSANNGGTNPIQLGFGAGTGAIDTNFTQGSLNPTGRTLDLGIQGNGFFVLRDGTRNVFSRAGGFDVDGAGFLIDPNSGLRVQRVGTTGEPTPTTPGFQTVGNQDIRIPFGAGVPGTPSANVSFQGNISAATPNGQNLSALTIQIFDTQGFARNLSVTLTKVSDNTFTISSATVTGGTVAVPANTITFDGNGVLVGPANVAVTLGGLPGPQTITLQLGTPGQTDGLTQFGTPTGVGVIFQDGRAPGTLTSVSVDTNGTVQGLFSNGLTQPLAQLAIASFANSGGLSRQGNNFFSATPSSGEALIGIAASGGRGTIQGGALEQGNVDIAIEFSRLIIAQRGFQINARTITVGNEVLQELASLVR